MELVVVNGQVEFVMKAGKDLVKNTMSEGAAMAIIKNGTVSQKEICEGFALCVDDKFYFKAVEKKTAPTIKKTKKTEESE